MLKIFVGGLVGLCGDEGFEGVGFLGGGEGVVGVEHGGEGEAVGDEGDGDSYEEKDGENASFGRILGRAGEDSSPRRCYPGM